MAKSEPLVCPQVKSMELAEIVNNLSIPSIERHLFLCADQTKPKCCDHEIGLQAWEYLKRRISELELNTKVFRTKANCLRVCQQGPILVIYPDRVWYHSCTETTIEQILQEHIIGNQIVPEFLLFSPTVVS
jgi:(2Fe-2S) ferredoxin